jgi:hypothetical protein
MDWEVASFVILLYMLGRSHDEKLNNPGMGQALV